MAFAQHHHGVCVAEVKDGTHVICTAATTVLVSIAEDLRAFVYSHAHDCTTTLDITDYRDPFSGSNTQLSGQFDQQLQHHDKPAVRK